MTSPQFGQHSAELLAALHELRDVDLATAPRDAVLQIDKMVLYRYRPLPGCERGKQAVLICYALINRPTMLDLQADRSLIRGLLAQDVDVFLIDWGYPDGADRYLDSRDYLDRYLHGCVQRVKALRNETQVNLLGVCQGGTMSLWYAALYPTAVRRLITMVTPVDFHSSDDVLSKWARQVDVPTLVRAWGNVPGALFNSLFVSLMPFRLLAQKYAGLPKLATDHDKLANFMRMERWIFDCPDQAGAFLQEFVVNMYQHNRLVNDEFTLGGRQVQLRNIVAPVLNVYGTLDHLVPPAASQRLRDFIPAQRYQELAFAAGHIGVFVTARAQAVVPDAVATFLSRSFS